VAVFILVHGSWQGGWCWSEVTPLLHAAGHEVVALDLPAHGEDQTPVHAVTLGDYTRTVVNHLHASPEPAIVVAHSMAGSMVQAAASASERVRALVYLSAIVPLNGMTMLSVVQEYDEQYLRHIVWAADGRSATITAEGARQYLYSEAPPGIAERAIARFTPEPVAPFAAPVEFDVTSIRALPAFYVECTRDRVVSLALQRRMRLAAGIAHALSIDCDHSPFFSAPHELAECLRRVVDRTA
jgi:pimeloyl-ACP methyl ester carboxylesterase